MIIGASCSHLLGRVLLDPSKKERQRTKRAHQGGDQGPERLRPADALLGQVVEEVPRCCLKPQVERDERVDQVLLLLGQIRPLGLLGALSRAAGAVAGFRRGTLLAAVHGANGTPSESIQSNTRNYHFEPSGDNELVQRSPRNA